MFGKREWNEEMRFESYNEIFADFGRPDKHGKMI